MQNSSFSLSVQCLCLDRVEIFPFLCLLHWLFSIVTLIKPLESEQRMHKLLHIYSLSNETVLIFELITFAAPDTEYFSYLVFIAFYLPSLSKFSMLSFQ